MTKRQTMNSIKKRLRYSDQELIEFKHLIETRIAEANKIVMDLHNSLKTSNELTSGNPTHDIDDYTDYAEKDHLHLLIARQQKHIHNLKRALERIGNKTYGICRVTGELIDKRRLMIVPHTTLCVKAKNYQL